MSWRFLAALTVVSIFWAFPISVEASVPKVVTSVAEHKSDAALAETWLFDHMVKLAPPGRKLWYPDSEETKEEAEKRYRGIARDIVEVVYNPTTKVPFKGPLGRTRTASLILSVMFHESGFMKHVDYGLGKYARGDQGDSWCMMQLNIGQGRTLKWNRVHDRLVQWKDRPQDIFEGFTGEELIEDRKRCIQEGLKVLRVSMSTCRSQPLLLQLSSYASGKCYKGHEESRLRVGMAIRIFSSTKTKRNFQESSVVPEIVARLSAHPTTKPKAKDSTTQIAHNFREGALRPD